MSRPPPARTQNVATLQPVNANQLFWGRWSFSKQQAPGHAHILNVLDFPCKLSGVRSVMWPLPYNPIRNTEIAHFYNIDDRIRTYTFNLVVMRCCHISLTYYPQTAGGIRLAPLRFVRYLRNVKNMNLELSTASNEYLGHFEESLVVPKLKGNSSPLTFYILHWDSSLIELISVLCNLIFNLLFESSP